MNFILLVIITAIVLLLLICIAGTKSRKSKLNKLYPPIEPYNTFYLPVDSAAKWEIYVEQVGNPAGIPILFLHGGPGLGISPAYRQFFNPQKFRVILFDQRGSGKTRGPKDVLVDNTTWGLVEDIEEIRRHLGIERWYVFGGSWGSALSLIYAIVHTDKVLGLFLRGVFLARPQDANWYYKYGANQIFAPSWSAFVAPLALLKSELRQDPMRAYLQLLQSKDEQLLQRAALAWTTWDLATSTFSLGLPPLPSSEKVREEAKDFSVNGSLVLCHYSVNQFFMPTDNWILQHASRLKAVPIHIVQGQYDFICPLAGAWELYNLLAKDSGLITLDIIPAAGHSALDPPIADALIKTLSLIPEKN